MSGALKIVHVVPGRLRLRLCALREAPPERAGEIADALVREDGILDVRVSRATGSVLVLYDETQLAAGEVAELARRATGAERILEPDEEEPEPEPAPAPKRPSRLALETAAAFESLNRDVRRATDGHADLATLLPFGFIGLGLAEVVATREVPAPPWWSLFWWSFRSFLSLNDPAIREAGRGSDREPAASRS